MISETFKKKHEYDCSTQEIKLYEYMWQIKKCPTLPKVALFHQMTKHKARLVLQLQGTQIIHLYHVYKDVYVCTGLRLRRVTCPKPPHIGNLTFTKK